MLTGMDSDDTGRMIGRGFSPGGIATHRGISNDSSSRFPLLVAATTIAVHVASAAGLPAMAAEHRADPVSRHAGAMPASMAKAPEKPVALRTSFISETRLGLLAQDPWSPEAQTGALHGEVLFARPVRPSDPLMRYFTPQPHIGASFNLGSRTSFVFAGLSWNIDLSPRVFVEASFGGALHDGHRGGVLRDNQAALGCAPLFRESASLGYRFSERLSFMATVEHYGNAGLCSQNRGLTNIGARFGYSF
ncbi:MAG: Lipid A 3-O-deacylase (PagL) [Saliniramus fredricksonii]|uniref:Lipid A 3-O-deacylase (PagL) n=1 Tax=Saliniramus fredricksonii TaxID=1653334 RepID=A0A0P7X6Q1_9HYPH|nr:acyloxyacyl hydrolase [Saliniramus fredricksonii]KPQ10709.1 MAG: Lipid A 3-O-deacylase (PagL) [Saliniramus fredricksonii]SCC79586.1 Lipid A 3-O-deacylase (PagL) [Saliniramus fredricksonii]